MVCNTEVTFNEYRFYQQDGNKLTQRICMISYRCTEPKINLPVCGMTYVIKIEISDLPSNEHMYLFNSNVNKLIISPYLLVYSAMLRKNAWYELSQVAKIPLTDTNFLGNLWVLLFKCMQDFFICNLILSNRWFCYV